MPLLEKELEEAQLREEPEIKVSQWEEKDLPITQEDAERLLRLLAEAENIHLTDPTIMGIILEESGAFFEGRKTSEEVCGLIQSKVSIYLAE